MTHKEHMDEATTEKAIRAALLKRGVRNVYINPLVKDLMELFDDVYNSGFVDGLSEQKQ